MLGLGLKICEMGPQMYLVHVLITMNHQGTPNVIFGLCQGWAMLFPGWTSVLSLSPQSGSVASNVSTSTSPKSSALLGLTKKGTVVVVLAKHHSHYRCFVFCFGFGSQANLARGASLSWGKHGGITKTW